LTLNNIRELAWDKGSGLLPAVVTDADIGDVLMVGFMNQDALAQTLQSRRVTFFSRSRNCLWQKGETSGHVLHLVAAYPDCDGDTILIKAIPHGPTCHRGMRSCFGPSSHSTLAFIAELEALIHARAQEPISGSSYTQQLLASGIHRIAQKVGEEGVETVIAAVTGKNDALVEEAADLLYHLLVLLAAHDKSLLDVIRKMKERHTNALDDSR
jgi:phosphoribosyl-ATP pyrophosphohydrolase/phosphoribosyl-AMP cyclohydrolase